MEWIEKYSDFDELRKNKLALFFKENRYVQLLKRISYKLFLGLVIFSTVLSIVFKNWSAISILFLFLGQRFSNRKGMENRYLPVLGFLMVLVASFLIMRDFIQQQSHMR
jgi:hypothetical protein